MNFQDVQPQAGNRIGVARLDLPEHLPTGATADPLVAKMEVPDFENFKTVKGNTLWKHPPSNLRLPK